MSSQDSYRNTSCLGPALPKTLRVGLMSCILASAAACEAPETTDRGSSSLASNSGTNGLNRSQAMATGGNGAWDASPGPVGGDDSTGDGGLADGGASAGGGFNSPRGAGHPEARFPTVGPHDLACMDCHNAALGPNGRDNADCVGCHLGSHLRIRMDEEHDDVNGYPTGDAPPNFCLACHADGTEGEDEDEDEDEGFDEDEDEGFDEDEEDEDD